MARGARQAISSLGCECSPYGHWIGAQRYDGAFYISGYAVELTLKARICKTLQWNGFPDSNKEFERFSSFRVHDLAVLLKLTGRERMVMTQHAAEWSIVADCTNYEHLRRKITAH